ncbi:NAD(P)/FAD-dependent oxidoreductase [Roseovarius sp. D22-M7]|uniref:NAD(P)/FAD-dependent oxidoreductase n=1 Tax=Roseovarius sp. D22-M7 TaxID=3127116 RepID=UPI003010506D
MSMAGDSTEIAVIGAGLVGSALALGLARTGARVTLVDAATDDFHASAANFGLVWVQGKGLGAPDYAGLSLRAAQGWDGFAADLAQGSGISPAYRRTGGLRIALSEAELDRTRADLARLHNQPGGAQDTRILDRDALRAMLPGIGPAAVGAAYCPHDGHADPLRTLRAMRTMLPAQARIKAMQVTRVRPEASGFVIEGGEGRVTADRVVLAAGLGNADLAPGLGLHAPLRPQRGQILVTERLPPLLDIATHNVRQTADGTVMMGDSKEDAGFDRGTTQSVAHKIATRAVRSFPALAHARLVRSWAGLRVMSPDGLPIYEASTSNPGAYLVTCHSGVTLASLHAGEVARAIAEDALHSRYPAFSPARFAEAA